jgi:GT2 family glycosyltransferase
MKLVSIITVNYNQKLVTEAMLESIFSKNTYQPVEIIVIDNASADNPIDDWRKRYPNVIFIRSERNLGFAGGNNLGIAVAKGDFHFLANNDTEFTDSLIGKLVTSLEADPKAGIISPKIRYYDKPDMLQYAGFTEMNYYTARNKCVGQFETDSGQYDHLTGETAFVHGAAMMIKRAALQQAGPMAENYFLYYEEMDWCERIRKAGYKILLNMDALIYHKESVSVGAQSPLKEYFMNRNRILFIRRNCSSGTQLLFWCYFLSIVVPRNILSYVKEKRTNFVPVLLKAILWNITHGTESTDLGYPVKQ